ncbi:hypothetical protein SAY87_019037 [Trapa incisa]|uniref:Uncharacterized protein n=1 Tax=Trapa incisa TaxID=236973 RepID=A0AAN7K0Y0_9MYRT|nr:hypothetical protein SAY87_019037 [Trapa incisa]
MASTLFLGSNRSWMRQEIAGSPDIFNEREVEEDERFRRFGDEESSIIREEGDRKELHKFRHRIVLSDVVFNNHRWSDVSLPDLMFSIEGFPVLKPGRGNPVRGDHTAEGDRYRIGHGMDRKRRSTGKFRSTGTINMISPDRPMGNWPCLSNGSEVMSEGEKKSKWEIVAVSRVRGLDRRLLNYGLPIGTRTVQWSSSRDEKVRPSISYLEDSMSMDMTNTTGQVMRRASDEKVRPSISYLEDSMSMDMTNTTGQVTDYAAA